MVYTLPGIRLGKRRRDEEKGKESVDEGVVCREISLV